MSDTSHISKGISLFCGQLNQILFSTDCSAVFSTQLIYSLLYRRHLEPEVDAAPNLTDPLRGTR